MNFTESFSRNHVTVMAETKRKVLPSLFEEVLGVVLVLTLRITWLFKYLLDLVRYSGIFSYLLKLVFVIPDQKNPIFLIKLTQILNSSWRFKYRLVELQDKQLFIFMFKWSR